jgi:hypothetical protein
MDRPRIPTIIRTRRGASRRRLRTWLCSGLLFALPLAARAESVVLPDPIATTAQADVAGALSLLVRSALKPGARPIVPRRELALAIEAVTGHTPGRTLTVSSDLAPKLMDRLGADGLVLWQLAVGAKGTTVSGTMLGRGGKRILRLSATAATGDVATLAAKLAAKLAPVIGATLNETPDIGLADLRPFIVAESALVSGDTVAASRATDMVVPKAVEKLPAAKDILRAIAEDASLSALPRTQARILRGEWAEAAELADAGLAKEPRNVMLRAAHVRALAAQKKIQAAERELALLKGTRNFTALALAQVSLAIARGDSQAKLDEALAPLLGRPAGEWRAVLPLIAATPPGTFGKKVEAAALAAAEKLLGQEPGLASTLAARALAGGADARATAGMIRVQELSAEQINALSTRLRAEADSAAVGLHQQIKARQDEAKEIEEDAGPQRPTGPPSTLATNLLPVLQAFEALYEPSLTAIQIAPLPGSGQPFYWPFYVRQQNLAEGLLETLMRAPWELRATNAKLDTEALPESRFTDEHIASMAHDMGAAALLLYRIRPSGISPWVAVELVLYDSSNQRTERLEASLVGRSTGLVILNPLVIVMAVLIFLAALAWTVVISMRGAIQVRVQWDSDAKDELFSIRISKDPKTPAIENIGAYRRKLEWIGRRKRRFEAWNIEQNTVFRGIPRGKWYVHLYGIFTRGRQTMVLHEPPQEALVVARRTTFVGHVLEAAEAEFKIKVIDDVGPVEGARVWIDEEHGKPAATAKDGCVSFKVPKGYHVIHVLTRGMNVERPYHVVKAKLHEFIINLVWERRQEYVSRALERQVDDAEQYMAKNTRRSTGAFKLQAAGPAASSAARPAPAAPPADASEIVDLTPSPAAPPAPARAAAPAPRASGAVPAQAAPATARGLPAPAGTPAAPAPGTFGLKPLAPQPAPPPAVQPPVPLPAPPAAVPADEVPLDLDMSGAIRAQAPPPAAPSQPPAPTRKPGR